MVGARYGVGEGLLRPVFECILSYDAVLLSGEIFVQFSRIVVQASPIFPWRVACLEAPFACSGEHRANSSLTVKRQTLTHTN